MYGFTFLGYHRNIGDHESCLLFPVVLERQYALMQRHPNRELIAALDNMLGTL